MQMSHEELLSVSAWEIRLMQDADEGLTNKEIAAKRGKSRKSIDKSFERLRDKLRPWGGGTKPGLVHWIDTYSDAWSHAVGLKPKGARRRLLPTGPGGKKGDYDPHERSSTLGRPSARE